MIFVKSRAVMPACIIVLGAIASGCGSAQSVPLQSSNAVSSASSVSAGCKVDNGVSLHPCKVILDNSKPDATITAKGPKGGKFSYNDQSCSKKAIAVVAPGSKMDTYTVTAGGNSGKCTIEFTDKSKAKILGTAKLYVTNEGV